MLKLVVSLDAAPPIAVVQASNIVAQNIQCRQSKDYLRPEEIVECEKYRLQRDYGMAVTEELVRKDSQGGRLISQVIALESILATLKEKLLTPTLVRISRTAHIVADKDLKERDNLPLCMDWHNYSSKWLARYNSGFAQASYSLHGGRGNLRY